MTAGIFRPHPPIGPLALSVAAVASGAVVILVVPRSHAGLTTYASGSVLTSTADLSAGLALAVAAVVVGLARPRSLNGLIAFLAGIAWFAPDAVGWVGGPHAVRTIGMVVAPFLVALIAHLVIRLLRGGVARPIERAIAAAYALTVVVSVGSALFRDPFRDAACWSNCSVNDLLLTHVEPVRRALDVAWLGLVLSAGVGLGAYGLNRVLRGERSSLQADRAGGVALAAGAVFGLAEVARVVALLGGRVEDPTDPLLLALFVSRALAVTALAAAAVGTVVADRRRRAAVARLAADVGSAPVPGTLRQALAAALGDPTVDVAYWLPDRGMYVDIDGEAVRAPGVEDHRSLTPIVRGGERLAIVVHDASLPMVDVAGEIGAAARLALDNERLAAAVQARLLDLRQSRSRIVEAGDAERRRLERDLHDGAQQRLLALSYELRLARALADAEGDEPQAHLLAGANDLAQLAIDDLRDVAHGMFPAVLTEAGLGPALESIADRAGIPVKVEALAAGRCPEPTEMAGYFVALEAVALAARQGAAYATIRTERQGAELRLVVGADRAEADIDDDRLADRVGAVGGRLAVDHGPGELTSIRAEFPCA